MKVSKLREILNDLDSSCDDLKVYVDADNHDFASSDNAGIAYMDEDHDFYEYEDDIDDMSDYSDRIFMISGS
jgi:hypothetical protein